MRIKSFRIGSRLAIGFGLIIALLLVVAASALIRIQTLSGRMKEIVAETYPLTVAANKMKADVSETSGLMLYSLTGAASGQTQTNQMIAEGAATRMEGQIDLLRKAKLDSQSAAMMDSILQLHRDVKKRRGAFFEAVAAGNKPEAETLYAYSIRPLFTKYLAVLNRLIDQQHDNMEAAGAESALLAQRTALLIVGVAIAAVVLSILVAIVITRSITVPLVRAVHVAERVAGGDLGGEVPPSGADETGQLMRSLATMNESLKDMVGQVRYSTDAIATTSTEIASGNFDLSVRTEEQSAALQQTASSMNQLVEGLRKNADNAQQADLLAASASRVANDGGQAVAEVLNTMTAINDASRKVGDIVQVIEGIAFRTNILALNAAVEAAHAGENGRGFAVVASEVRGLAEQAAAAARQIAELVNESVRTVAHGCELVKRADGTMTEIVQGVRAVSTVMAEMASVIQSQTHDVESINDTVRQMDLATQQNAALVEQVAAASEAMKDQAVSLKLATQVFKLGHDESPGQNDIGDDMADELPIAA